MKRFCDWAISANNFCCRFFALCRLKKKTRSMNIVRNKVKTNFCSALKSEILFPTVGVCCCCWYSSLICRSSCSMFRRQSASRLPAKSSKFEMKEKLSPIRVELVELKFGSFKIRSIKVGKSFGRCFWRIFSSNVIIVSFSSSPVEIGVNKLTKMLSLLNEFWTKNEKSFFLSKTRIFYRIFFDRNRSIFFSLKARRKIFLFGFSPFSTYR